MVSSKDCNTPYLEQWSFIMAHEFFDALPIHVFEVRKEKGIFQPKKVILYFLFRNLRKLNQNGEKCWWTLMIAMKGK